MIYLEIAEDAEGIIQPNDLVARTTDLPAISNSLQNSARVFHLVQTPLKHIRQIGLFPEVGMKIKNR